MIIVEIAGGLGNQFFQYAAGLALAKRRGVPLRLDVSHFSLERPPGLNEFPRAFKLQHFAISAEPIDRAAASAVRDRFRRTRLRILVRAVVRRLAPRLCLGLFVDRTANYDPLVLDLPDNTYLHGYFQSERYFAEVVDQVRQEFTFRDAELPAYGQRYVEERRKGGRPVVAVHVRRGDLAMPVTVSAKRPIVHGPPVSVEYLRQAMAEFDDRQPTFLVFSDTSRDLDWCKEALADSGKDLHFCYGHNDLQDFAVMQACDHQIMSNSTFSWWAAWLNRNPNKRIIAPRLWYHPGMHPGFRIRDLIPERWKLL